MNDETTTTGKDSTSGTSPQRTRVPLFITLILAAIFIYCASAGPVLYLTVIIDRKFAGPEWLGKVYKTVYRPHLDLCYHQEKYFDYLNWFIFKAGERGSSHSDFKEFWEVEAGYRDKTP